MSFRKTTVVDVEAEAIRWHTMMEGGSITSSQRAAFDAWLACDSRHARVYADMVELSDTIGELKDLSVLAAIRESSTAIRRTTPAKPPRWVMAGVAAGIAGAVAVGVVSWSQPPSYATKIGETRSVVLPDGSQVALGADTTVKVRYGSDLRLIELRHGEAYFVVWKDKHRPFVVSALGTDIRAVGTQFDVVDRPTGVTVAVTEGQVVVEPTESPPDVAGLVRHVSKGEQLEVLKNGDTRARGLPDIDMVASWRSNHLVFVDQPLQDVVSDLNRYLPDPVVLADPDLRNLKVSAVIDAGDPQAIMSVIESSLGVREIRGPEGISLTRAEHP